MNIFTNIYNFFDKASEMWMMLFLPLLIAFISQIMMNILLSVLRIKNKITYAKIIFSIFYSINSLVMTIYSIKSYSSFIGSIVAIYCIIFFIFFIKNVFHIINKNEGVENER